MNEKIKIVEEKIEGAQQFELTLDNLDLAKCEECGVLEGVREIYETAPYNKVFLCHECYIKNISKGMDYLDTDPALIGDVELELGGWRVKLKNLDVESKGKILATMFEVIDSNLADTDDFEFEFVNVVSEKLAKIDEEIEVLNGKLR